MNYHDLGAKHTKGGSPVHIINQPRLALTSIYGLRYDFKCLDSIYSIQYCLLRCVNWRSHIKSAAVKETAVLLTLHHLTQVQKFCF